MAIFNLDEGILFTRVISNCSKKTTKCTNCQHKGKKEIHCFCIVPRSIYIYKDNVNAHNAPWVKLIEAVAALCKWDFLQFLGLTKCFELSLIW